MIQWSQHRPLVTPRPCWVHEAAAFGSHEEKRIGWKYWACVVLALKSKNQVLGWCIEPRTIQWGDSLHSSGSSRLVIALPVKCLPSRLKDGPGFNYQYPKWTARGEPKRNPPHLSGVPPIGGKPQGEARGEGNTLLPWEGGIVYGVWVRSPLQSQ